MGSSFATYDIEDGIWELGCEHIVGVDEVGRGPGAGPVVAGAVVIPRGQITRFMGKIKDSKKLSEKRREDLYYEIAEYCRWSVAAVDNHIIDEINILNATKLAMQQAVLRLGDPVDYVLVDGTVELKGLWCPQQQVIKGDVKSISIAAASIMAKVTRDEEMRTLHWIYPEYGWIRNKGYLTKEHIEAIKTYGITNHHRKSFRKVGDYTG